MTISELKERLQHQFPDACVQCIGEGWSSIAFCVNDKIIRIPKVNIEQYKKEVKLLDFLQGKLSIQIPHPYLVEGELRYAIHTKITGKSWSIKTYNALSEQVQNDFCYEIANFFYELHQIPVSDIIDVIPEKDLKSYSLCPREIMYSDLKSIFSESDVNKIYDFCYDTYSLKTDPVLLHKDFWEANSLVDDDHHLMGVFDFANACLGDRAWDFRTLYHPQYLSLLEKVISFYEKLSGFKIDLHYLEALDKADCLFCVQYFIENPEMKKKMPNQWQKQILRMRQILKELNSLNLK